MTESLNVVDLFCGAGGLSLGFQGAGYNILTAIDNNPNSIESYSKNIKSRYKTICNSITKIQPKELLNYIKMNAGELDLLIGGPPCRGFSQANRQTREKNNQYNKLIHHYLEFVETVNPKTFLFENVLGLTSFNNGSFYEQFLAKMKKLRYIINQFIFNCKDYGIPQKRERIIIIGTKRRKKINLKIKKEEIVSVKEAIDDLPELYNGNRRDGLSYKKESNLTSFQREMRKCNVSKIVYNNLVTRNNDLVLERYKFIKQGGNWREIPRKLMKNYSNVKNCHSSIYYRLKNNEPSITLCNYRKNMIIHPTQHRGLSVREAARLQSFPDNFIFKGGIHSQQQQVANAVPPKLSKLIAIEILKYFHN